MARALTCVLALLLISTAQWTSAQAAQSVYEKAKQTVGLSPPSATDQVKDAASDVYNAAAKHAGPAAQRAGEYASDAASEYYDAASKNAGPAAQRAGEYASETADSLSATSAERYEALKAQIGKLGQPAQKSYYEKAKDYITGAKTPTEQAQDYASDTYNAAGKRAQSAYEAAAEAGSDTYHSAGKVASDAADSVKDTLSGGGKTAKGQAKRARDAASQTGSDAYNAASDTASDAYDSASETLGSGQKSAKQGYNKAAKQASDTYNQAGHHANKASKQASDAANQAGNHASHYASKGKKAAGETYDQAADAASTSMGDLKAALTSYSEWLQDVMSEVKTSTSNSAQDAAAWGRDSSGSTQKYSESAYNKAKKNLSDQLGSARSTSDSLLTRTQHNSKELWASLSERWEAATPSDKKSLAKEWGLAQKGNTDFGGWLDSTRSSLSEAYTNAEKSAESAWAKLKKGAGKAADAARETAEL